MSRPVLILTLLVSLVRPAHAQPVPDASSTPPASALRVATFNVLDISSDDLRDPHHPRLKRLAEVIQRLRPNVLLLNEIAYDTPGVHGEGVEGTNAALFVKNFLETSQGEGLDPITFRAFMGRPNTGMPSGFDLDRSGEVVTTYPTPVPSDASGAPPPQTPDGRAFGGDSWGFGVYPGQYAMALLVDPRLGFDPGRVRTFRLFPWNAMPGALVPRDPETGDPWYSDDAYARFRLSSKSHWIAPITLPNGAELHIIAAHPTPPAFDGPDGRNKMRNHDEIRMIADMLENAEYLVDDKGVRGGIPRTAHAVVLGDLNADPDEGTSYRDPIDLLLDSARILRTPAPLADVDLPGMDLDDTARFRLRVDYVLPTSGLQLIRSGVWRTPPRAGEGFPSDHFPVWADLAIPAPRTP